MYVAGVYNLAWGAFLILAPLAAYQIGGLAAGGRSLVNVEIWQCLGMVVGVYGVGYLMAAADPVLHWRLVLVGLISKVLGPIGFVAGAVQGRLPWQMAVTNLFNDVIWWIPFGLILAEAWRVYRDDVGKSPPDPPEVMLTRARTQYGSTLAELSGTKPVVLIFLRHLGCSFCKLALADAAQCRSTIESRGRQLALVHMADDAQARQLFAKYGLEDVARVSDPEQELYRAFQLRRSSLLELFSPVTLYRYAQAFCGGYFNGPIVGDGLRLGGAYLIRNGRIAGGTPYASIVDRPDFCNLPNRS